MNSQEMKAIRMSLELNQSEFADVIGRARRSVVGWEGGDPIPKLVALVVRYIDKYGLPETALSGGAAGARATPTSGTPTSS